MQILSSELHIEVASPLVLKYTPPPAAKQYGGQSDQSPLDSTASLSESPNCLAAATHSSFDVTLVPLMQVDPLVTFSYPPESQLFSVNKLMSSNILPLIKISNLSA